MTVRRGEEWAESEKGIKIANTQQTSTLLPIIGLILSSYGEGIRCVFKPAYWQPFVI